MSFLGTLLWVCFFLRATLFGPRVSKAHLLFKKFFFIAMLRDLSSCQGGELRVVLLCDPTCEVLSATEIKTK